MIDIVELTPKIYSKKSRDYQLVSRLQSAIYNVSRLYADGMHVWEQDIDNKLAVLRAKTLNLNTRYSWDLDDLEALTDNFKHIIRIKGTKAALVDCLNIILRAEKIEASVTSDNIVIDSKHLVTITLPHKLSTTNMIEDIIKLFMPSGLTYRILYDEAEKAATSQKSDLYLLNGTVDKDQFYWFDGDSEFDEEHSNYFSKKMVITDNEKDSEGHYINEEKNINATFIYNESEVEEDQEV